MEQSPHEEIKHMAQDVRNFKPQPRSNSDQAVREQPLQIILVDPHLLTRQAFQHVVASFGHMHILASLSTIDDVLTVTNTLAEQVAVLGPSIPISDCLT